jgi:fatty acid desaturase
MNAITATTAETSGVRIDKKTLKALMRRSDRPGLAYLGLWALFLAGSGALLALSLGTWAGTRWLNEAVFWLTSLIYFEGPHYRRYAHARHHTYTWIRGRDAQMPFNTPLTFKGWLLEVSGIGQYLYDARHMVLNALGRFDPEVRDFTPASELPKLKWEARVFLAVYLAAAAAIASGGLWVLTYLVVPRLVGGVVMQLYTIIQHAEMEENQLDLRKSARSFTTNWFADFLYANMSNHVEHHLYPTVPFHALPRLNAELRDQLPAPDRGLLRPNAEVLGAVLRRSFGRQPVAGAA